MAKKQSKNQSKSFADVITSAVALMLSAAQQAANMIGESVEVQPVISAIAGKDWVTVSRILKGTYTSRKDVIVAVPGMNSGLINNLCLIHKAGIWNVLSDKKFVAQDGEEHLVSINAVANNARAILRASGKASGKMKRKSDPLSPLFNALAGINVLKGMERKRALYGVLSTLVSLDVLDEETATKLL